VSEVIDCVHGVAQREEMMDEVHVSPAVFRKAVNDEEHRLRFAFRKPLLVIDPVIPDALEKPLFMFHNPASILSGGAPRSGDILK
jgi:hypothetical protein